MKSPAEIAAFTSDVGVVKSKLGIPRMIALGFLAGFFIALAGAASNTASALISNASVAKIISGCVFPAGLTMVLCAGSELFTGNSLMAVALLDKRIKLRHMLKNWLFVYVGNYVGSVLAAALLSLSGQFGMFGGKVALTTVTAAANKCALGFGQAFVLGILCNVLVCVAVWISFGADSVGGKIAGLFFPIMVFVICGFEHSIANMYYIPAGIFAQSTLGLEQAAPVVNLGMLSWKNFFIHNLLPVTLGNIVGGVSVAVIYSAVYRGGKGKKRG